MTFNALTSGQGCLPSAATDRSKGRLRPVADRRQSKAGDGFAAIAFFLFIELDALKLPFNV